MQTRSKSLLVFFCGITLFFTLSLPPVLAVPSKSPASATVSQAASDIPSEEASLNLYAKAAVLMDADSGRILYEKNSSQIMPMASTTKIMTCILALENSDLTDYAEFSSYACSMPKVHLGAKTGDYFKMEDLLYSLMLESHNDSAVAIAEKIAGSTQSFAALMNKKAREIGCTDTFFITPNGLDAVATASDGQTRIHSTTATDLARIMSYCITKSPQKEKFLSITRTPSYSFTSYTPTNTGFCSTGKSYSCTNHNAFLHMMEGALSGKTGFTGNAGYCYVGSLRKEDRTFVVALLACGWPNNKNYKWSDTKQLMTYGLENYESHTLEEYLYPENLLPVIPVTDSQTKQLGSPVYETPYIVRDPNRIHEKFLLTSRETISTTINLEESLSAPVTAGQKIGEVRYFLNNDLYYTESIHVPDAMQKINFSYFLLQTIRHFFP